MHKLYTWHPEIHRRASPLWEAWRMDDWLKPLIEWKRGSLAPHGPDRTGWDGGGGAVEDLRVQIYFVLTMTKGNAKRPHVRSQTKAEAVGRGSTWTGVSPLTPRLILSQPVWAWPEGNEMAWKHTWCSPLNTVTGNTSSKHWLSNSHK